MFAFVRSLWWERRPRSPREGVPRVPCNHRWKWSSVRITHGTMAAVTLCHISRLCFFCFSAWVGLEGASTGNHVVLQTKMALKPVDGFPLNQVLRHGSAPKKRCPKSHGLACFPTWIAIHCSIFPYIYIYIYRRIIYPDIRMLCSL